MIYLACLNEDNRDEWVSSLHTASYECLMMQLENLREQITLKTGRDPLTHPHVTSAKRFGESIFWRPFEVLNQIIVAGEKSLQQMGSRT